MAVVVYNFKQIAGRSAVALGGVDRVEAVGKSSRGRKRKNGWDELIRR